MVLHTKQRTATAAPADCLFPAAAQALVDGYTAAFYNAFFTALPIGIFSVVDRPFRHLNTFMRFPQVCLLAYLAHPVAGASQLGFIPHGHGLLLRPSV